MQDERRVLVVESNGRTTVVTGWRAWLLTFGAIIGVAATFVFLAFVFLGLALTIGAVLLVALPVAIAVALIGLLMGRRG